MINNEKSYSKCEYCQKDYQLKILKRHIKTVHGVEPRPKLNIHEKSVYDEYMNLAKKYSHIIKVCPPENYGPTPQELEKYNLSKEIESYIQIPEQTNEIDDYSPTNSKITKYNTSNYKNPVQCSKCPLKFSNANKLENHDLLNHSSHYQCNNCQKVYSLNLKEEFKIHIYRHEKMNVKAHECIHCGFSSYIAKSMIQHLNHAGPYHTNSCAHCQNKFQNYEDFKSHMETRHELIYAKNQNHNFLLNSYYFAKDFLCKSSFFFFKLFPIPFFSPQKSTNQMKPMFCSLCNVKNYFKLKTTVVTCFVTLFKNVTR